MGSGVRTDEDDIRLGLEREREKKQSLLFRNTPKSLTAIEEEKDKKITEGAIISL